MPSNVSLLILTFSYCLAKMRKECLLRTRAVLRARIRLYLISRVALDITFFRRTDLLRLKVSPCPETIDYRWNLFPKRRAAIILRIQYFGHRLRFRRADSLGGSRGLSSCGFGGGGQWVGIYTCDLQRRGR